MKRKFDCSTKEVERKCVDEIITRIDELDGSEVGVIAAQDIIDIVKQNLAPDIYNLGLADAKKLIQDKLDDLETSIDLLGHKA